MTAKLFEARVRQEGDVAVIDLRGDINAFAEEALNAAYGEAGNLSAGSVLLNFGDVEYINSTGIALIVGLMAHARKSQRRLVTYGLSDHYVEIFRITRLADFIGIFPDEQSALADSDKGLKE